MTLNSQQIKLLELTMELELHTKEYELLSEKLEQFKALNINPSDPFLLELLFQFKKNNEKIIKINKELKILKNGQ